MAQTWAEGVAMPFLLIAPDAHSSGLGNAGAATGPDVYSIHWNAAKYAFSDKEKGIGVSYTPWMRQLVNDRHLIHLAAFSGISELETVAASLKFFSMGEYILTDQNGSGEVPYTPTEWSLDASYIRKLSEEISASVSFRLLHSGLKAVDFITGSDTRAFGVAADIGFFYRTEFVTENRVSLGVTASNLGPRITYGGTSLPLPTKLSAGAAFDILGKGSRFTVIGEISGIINGKMNLQNRYSPFSAGFGSEWGIHQRLELRAGFIAENGIPRITTGFGMGFDDILIDLSYLVSTQHTDPLKNTLRVGVAYCMKTDIK